MQEDNDSKTLPKMDSRETVTAQFIDLANRAVKSHHAGRPDEAISLAREAESLAYAETLERTNEVACCVNSVGVIFFETGYVWPARRLYELAQDLVVATDPDGRQANASIANNLGQAFVQIGDLKSAKAQLETAVQLREAEAPDSLDLAFSYDNLGNVLSMLNELGQAESYHLRAVKMLEEALGPTSIHVATAYGNLGLVYRSRGSYLEAEAALLRALDIHERRSGLTSHGTAMGLAQLTILHWQIGDVAKADCFANILLSIGGENPTQAHRNLASILKMLAEGALNRFMLGLAERFASRSRFFLKTLDGPQSPATLEVQVLLAVVRNAQNDTKGAQQILLSVLSSYEALGMPAETTTTRVELAKVYRSLNSHDLARMLLETSIDEMKARAETPHHDLLNAMGNLALVFYESGDYKSADQMFLLAIEEADKTGDIDRPWLIHNRAMLHYHLGHYVEASDLYAEAKREWLEQRGDRHPFVATAAANQALVAWVSGDASTALAAFTEAERIHEPHIQRELAIGSESQRTARGRALQADLYKTLSFCLGVGKQMPDVSAFTAQMVLNRKGRVLDAIAHTFRHLHGDLSDEDASTLRRLDAVRHEIASLLTPTLIANAPSREPERLASLCAEEDRLTTSLSYRGALRRVGLEPVTLDEVRSAIPDGALLLEFVRYSVFDPERVGASDCWIGERYAAFTLGQRGGPNWTDLGAAEPIDAAIDRWREALYRTNSSPDELDNTAIDLQRLVIGPVEDAIADKQHILIAPDGKLSLVPFGLLKNEAGDVLMSMATLSYLNCGRELVQIGKCSEAPRDDTERDVVIIADPDFSADRPQLESTVRSGVTQRDGFEPLPGTKEEARVIEAMLDHVVLYTGERASTATVKGLSRPAVLHLATHGVFTQLPKYQLSWNSDTMIVADQLLFIQQPKEIEAANPMYCSGLALAGANKLKAGTSTGMLTAQEIAGLDLRGTELVVLSACETGLGSVAHGEEFTGLRRAFSIAGAATQVTSLWEVPDDATAALMIHYYSALLDGTERAVALQVAQDRVAHDLDHPEWKHPYYWAAFISSGAWGNMKVSLTKRIQ